MIDIIIIYIDSEFNESEFIFLIYFNEDWIVNYYGEIVFFDDMEGNEVIFVVRLRYGCVVIFYGLILYSV